MAYDSNAQPGQSFLTPWGEWRTVVSVTSAGLYIEARVAQQIREFKGTPSFTRDSIAGMCAMYGSSTVRRERRDIERAKLRANKPIRKLPEGEHV